MGDTEHFETIDRRRLLSRLGVIAAGGAAFAAADVALAGSADATVGAMQFGTGNNAGAAATDLTSSSTGAVLRLHSTNTTNGKGLFAEAQGNTAIWGETVKNQGVVGMANAPGGTDGVFGGSHATTEGAGAGVHGHHYTGDNPGVFGTIGPLTGLVTLAGAVQGDSQDHPGVVGLSSNANGVAGDSLTAYGGFFGGGIAGVLGTTRFGTAGAQGENSSTNGCGVLGTATGTGVHAAGVRGESDHGSGVVGVPTAVSGFSQPRAGVLGDSHDTAGVAGLSKNYIGVIGSGDVEAGVAGQSNSSDGVRGTSHTGAGVTGIATAQGGTGVHAIANGNNGVALLASIGNGVTGSAALGVQGAALFTGPNTLSGTTKLTGPTNVTGPASFAATASFAGTALFSGKALFARSGTVTIAAGHRTATASSIDLTSDSLVIATIQTGPTTNAVAAATPNVSGSTVKITLQKTATASTKVAFFVIN